MRDKLFKTVCLLLATLSSTFLCAEDRESVSATLTLQKYDLFLRPVEKPFKMRVHVEREGEEIHVTLPAFNTTLKKELFPLGGFIETVSGSIPMSFRPTSGMPVAFEFSKSNMVGYLDRFG